MNRKLGRKAVKRDSRTLRLAKYLGASLPEAPATLDLTKGVKDWGMMLNDQLGDCTIAALAHAEQVWSLNALGNEVTIPDDQIRLAYERWCGYRPLSPDTDRGGIPLDVLTNFRRDGLFGHKLLAFADANHTNEAELRQGMHLFGGAYVGMEVPNYVMQSDSTDWDVKDDESGIDGGHEVWFVGYDDEKYTFISWGKLYTMTKAFYKKYVDSVQVLLGADEINNGKGIDGFAYDQLLTDLSLIH